MEALFKINVPASRELGDEANVKLLSSNFTKEGMHEILIKKLWNTRQEALAVVRTIVLVAVVLVLIVRIPANCQDYQALSIKCSMPQNLYGTCMSEDLQSLPIARMLS